MCFLCLNASSEGRHPFDISRLIVELHFPSSVICISFSVQWFLSLCSHPMSRHFLSLVCFLLCFPSKSLIVFTFDFMVLSLGSLVLFGLPSVLLVLLFLVGVLCCMFLGFCYTILCLFLGC